MLRALALSSALVVAPIAAQAADQLPAGTVGTDVASGNAQEAPPSGPESKVIKFAHGWLRYQPDPEETPEGEPQWTVSIIPAPKPAPGEQRQAAGEPIPPPVEAAPMPAADEAAPLAEAANCQQTEDLLAQRLLHIRGIDVDPQTASLVLPQLEVPYSPVFSRDMNGLNTRYLGGTVLISALSWDLETQLLTAQLAECLRR